MIRYDWLSIRRNPDSDNFLSIVTNQWELSAGMETLISYVTIMMLVPHQNDAYNTLGLHSEKMWTGIVGLLVPEVPGSIPSQGTVHCSL